MGHDVYFAYFMKQTEPRLRVSDVSEAKNPKVIEGYYDSNQFQQRANEVFWLTGVKHFWRVLNRKWGRNCRQTGIVPEQQAKDEQGNIVFYVIEWEKTNVFRTCQYFSAVGRMKYSSMLEEEKSM